MPSPATTTSRRAAALPPEERRAAIVAATAALLIRHGEAVTTRQIAEACGIAEGTIFRAFPDKDALLEATLDAALDLATLERALSAIDAGLPLEQRLVEATTAIQQRIVDVWKLISSLGSRFHEKVARPLADSEALAALLRHDRTALRYEPEVAARMLRSLTLAMSHPMLVDEPMDARDIVGLFLHGAGAPR